MRPTEVLGVPVSVRLALLDRLFAFGSVIEKLVEEFNRQNFDVVDFFEN